MLPDGRCDIILQDNALSPKPATPIITGPGTLPYTVEYKKGDRWFGIRLRPYKGVILWQQQITCAKNRVLSGQDAIDVLPQLAELIDNGSTLNQFANSIDAQQSLLRDQRLMNALEALHLSGGRIRIAKMADFVGCTARQLNRLFCSNIGLTTKSYAQLVQFHRALKLVQREKLSITNAAFEGGYADHAHLTRAFKRYGGFTPSDLPPDLSVPVLFT